MQVATGEGRISGEDSARCTPPPPPLLRPRISPQSGERPGGATTIESIIRWHDESWPDLISDLTTRLELRSETWSLLHDDPTDSSACWCRCCRQLPPRQGTLFYIYIRQGLFSSFLRYYVPPSTRSTLLIFNPSCMMQSYCSLHCNKVSKTCWSFQSIDTPWILWGFLKLDLAFSQAG